MEPQDLARYPFLREASAYIAGQGLDILQVLDDIVYTDAVNMGRERVFMAVSDGELPQFSVHSEDSITDLIISYAVARIIVSTFPDTYLINRYSRVEAESAASNLYEESPEFVMSVASDMNFPLEYGERAGFRIHFTDYLIYSAGMRDTAWKLINQELKGGYVPLTKRKAVRLMQNAIEAKISEKLPLPLPDDILHYFRRETERLKVLVADAKSRFSGSDMGEYSPERLPPCIKHIMAMAQQGVNIPHMGRFALVSFLNAIGMEEEEIMAVFALSPDFREDLTRYQVEHITGISSGIEYNVPECSTMKTNGLCFAEEDNDSLCRKDWLKHPLQYYRIKGEEKEGSEKKKAKANKGKEEIAEKAGRNQESAEKNQEGTNNK